MQTVEWLSRHRAPLRLASRTTVAGLAAYALAHSLNLPQGYWAVFTAVLVVQASLGGSYKAAVDRLIGTLGGALYGAAIATLVPHSDEAALGMALGLSLAPLALLAAFNPSFRVAPITAIILLLGNAGVEEPPFLAAMFRALEVVLGGFVGVAVSLLFLPARAYSVVADTAQRVLDLQAELITVLFAALRGPPSDPLKTRPLHDKIRTTFDTLENATDEANRERRILLTAEDDPDPIPRTLRRAYHDMVVVGRIAAHPLSPELAEGLAAALAPLVEPLPEFLRAAGQAIAARKPSPPLAELEAALATTDTALSTLQGEWRGADGALLTALGFALDQLLRNLSDLAERIGEFAAPEPKRQG